MRLCFEWGATVHGEMSVFLRAAAALGDGGAFVGKDAPGAVAAMAAQGFCGCVESVAISPNPGHPPPAAGVFDNPGLLGGGGGRGLSCVLDGCTSRRFTIVVKWKAELGMAPIEIKYAFGPSPPPQLVRRLVVQLPAGVTTNSGAKKRDALVYPPEVEEGVLVNKHAAPNGWVLYSYGQLPKANVGARTFGRCSIHPHRSRDGREIATAVFNAAI